MRRDDGLMLQPDNDPFGNDSRGNSVTGCLSFTILCVGGYIAWKVISGLFGILIP